MLRVSGVVAFIYAIPKQSLIITGREHKEDSAEGRGAGKNKPRLSEEPPSLPPEE